MTREQFQIILTQVSGQPFRDYLTFLFETDARPQEIRVIEAWHCQPNAQRIVMPVSLSKGKKTPRVIFLTENIVNLISRHCEAFPDGPIFRNANGRPWTRDAVNCRVQWIRQKLKKVGQAIPGFCATALRHGLATDDMQASSPDTHDFFSAYRVPDPHRLVVRRTNDVRSVW